MMRVSGQSPLGGFNFLTRISLLMLPLVLTLLIASGQTNTNLITIPARVMDRDSRYITDLKKEDFQIFEDGVEQVLSFFPPISQPVTVLFLLDTSGSMTYRMDDLARAANVFANQLRPDDQLMAVSFSDSAWVDVLFEPTKISELRNNIRLRGRRDQWDTMIYDAVDNALKRIKKIRGRRAMVLQTPRSSK
jgi:VWFA-related protein